MEHNHGLCREKTPSRVCKILFYLWEHQEPPGLPWQPWVPKFLRGACHMGPRSQTTDRGSLSGLIRSFLKLSWLKVKFCHQL